MVKQMNETSIIIRSRLCNKVEINSFHDIIVWCYFCEKPFNILIWQAVLRCIKSIKHEKLIYNWKRVTWFKWKSNLVNVLFCIILLSLFCPHEQVWFSNRRAKWRRHQRMSNSHSSKFHSSISGQRDSPNLDLMSRDDSAASHDSFESSSSEQIMNSASPTTQPSSPASKSPQLSDKVLSNTSLTIESADSAFKKI